MTTPQARAGRERDAVDAAGARRGEAHERALIALVAVTAAVVVALGSWRVSLWYDEGATISAATRSVPELFRLVQHVDAVHGLYYLAMHAWTDVFGTSPVAVRAPSAIAVGVAAWGTWAWVRRLADSRTALLAAVVLVLLPRITWAGVEARSTAFTVALAVWAAYALVRAVSSSAWSWWAAYAVLATVGAVTSVYLALLGAAQAVSLAVRRAPREVWSRWIGATAMAAVLSAPVWITARAQAGQLGGVRLPLLQMGRSVVVNQWFLGATPTADGDGGGSHAGLGLRDAVTTPWLAAALALALGCCALVCLAFVPLPALRRRPGWLRDLATWAVPWLVVPSVLAVAWSAVATPVYHPRYLAFCAPALAALAAAGVRRVPGAAGQVVLVVLLGAMSLVVALSQRQVTAKSAYDWSGAADAVAAHREPGQAVLYGLRTPQSPPTRSVRLIASAYPAAFSGLRDVTLATDAREGGTLAGTSRPLVDSLAALEGTSGLWAVRWADYPRTAVADEDRLLAAAGLAPARTWHESQTDVTLYLPTG